jgi:hypothetical protein
MGIRRPFMAAWYRPVVIPPSWKHYFIMHIIFFMALKETELIETSSGWQPRQFYCLTRATSNRRTPPPFPSLCMPRRPVSLYYISVPGRGLRRTTSPTLELIKYHPIIVNVGSYYKPDVEDRISLWKVCLFEKFEVTFRVGWYLLKLF